MRLDRDRLPHLIMKYSCGKRSKERPLRRHLDCQWDHNRSRGLNSCMLCDDDDRDDTI